MLDVMRLMEVALPALREAQERQRADQQQELRTFDGRTLRVAAKASLLIQNANAREVLTMLGELAGITVQFAPDVRPPTPVSMHFSDAYVAAAFTYVLNVSNLRVEAINEQSVLVTNKP